MTIPTLTQIVGSTIPLTDGRADCPFCDPSATENSTGTFPVDEPKGRWSCRRCGAHGDAREFLRLYGADGALRWLDRQETTR